MKEKLFAAILSMMMAVTFIPVMAFAEDEDVTDDWETIPAGDVETIALDETKEITSYQQGETVCYKFVPEKKGNYVYLVKGVDSLDEVTADGIVLAGEDIEDQISAECDFSLYFEGSAGKEYFIKFKADQSISTPCTLQIVRSVWDNSKMKVTMTKTYTYQGRKSITPKCTVKYNGKTLKKNVDYYVFDPLPVVGEGDVGLEGSDKYPGQKWFTIKILPKGTNISKATGAKKSLKVTWKKQSMEMSTWDGDKRISKYQIKVATNKGFTKNAKTITVKGYKNTSKTIKSLKANKKYYVKIRTVIKVDGKTYYSPWSKAKTATTK